jgi:hypothetical protein
VKYKTVQLITLIFFKMVPLCNYTLLAVTINVLEPILATIFRKPSQFFRRIFNDISGIVKVPPPPSVLISVEGTGENQLELVQESIGDSPVFSHRNH